MSRRIVIIPTFASSHFLKCWIPNVIEVLNPDIIIINEGLFPNGPEDKGHVNSERFKEKYCHTKYQSAGFDFDETLKFFKFQTKDCKIGISIFDYAKKTASQCFLQCITSFGSNGNSLDEFMPEFGDIIIPIEPDAFHHEKDIAIISMHLNSLKPGEGIKTRWVDFLETQYYTEAINVVQPKYRRFAYCFDTMENYAEALDGFVSQSYPKLKQVDDFITYHYPWFVFDKWKELRYELIYRSDPQYWKYFEEGLQEIREKSKTLHLLSKTINKWNEYAVESEIFNKILLRPSRQDEGRWAKFINIEHPNAIKWHPNYIK